MKALSIFIVSCFTAVSVFAQSNIVVTVTLNGNLNREVLIDGTTYYPTDYTNTNSNNKNMITVNNLAPGQHRLQVVRTNAAGTRRTVGNQRLFNLRAGYDLDIVVNGNGTVQLTEKRIMGNRNPVAMTSTEFNSLLTSLDNLTSNTARVTGINRALRGNYFTSEQVSQMVQTVSGEATRLQLLKSSYRNVTDPANFSSLYFLLRSTSSRNELAAYVSANPNGNAGSTAVVAMNNARFNQILNSVTSQYNTEARVATIFDAFSNTANYFTANQAKRLIQTITGEANMIHLAKASYRSIVDKTNFATVYNIIPTTAGRNDVAAYVRTYDPNVVYNGNPGGVIIGRAAMSDADFNALRDNISRQIILKKAAVIEAFNAGNYFTVAQASQLIQMDNDEDDRLDMAKASYKTLVDPVNFVHIINLFTSSTYRAELTAYAQNNVNTGSTVGTGY